MTGILKPFVRKIRVARKADGWWVEKKYHGYWYAEIPIPYDTEAQAEAAMGRLKRQQELDEARGRTW